MLDRELFLLTERITYTSFLDKLKPGTFQTFRGSQSSTITTHLCFDWKLLAPGSTDEFDNKTELVSVFDSKNRIESQKLFFRHYISASTIFDLFVKAPSWEREPEPDGFDILNGMKDPLLEFPHLTRVSKNGKYSITYVDYSRSELCIDGKRFQLWLCYEGN